MTTEPCVTCLFRLYKLYGGVVGTTRHCSPAPRRMELPPSTGLAPAPSAPQGGLAPALSAPMRGLAIAPSPAPAQSFADMVALIVDMQARNPRQPRAPDLPRPRVVFDVGIHGFIPSINPDEYIDSTGAGLFGPGSS